MRTINPKLKLHGICCYASNAWFVFETDDNQLDFNKIVFTDFKEDAYTFKFIQYADIVPRHSALDDPIVKYEQVICS
jgi:hypothetical protein